MKRFLVATLCLVASASYAGITINGTTITFNDATVQSTAATEGGGAPADHGGTANTVNGTDSFIGGGNSNFVSDDYGTIGGGRMNSVGDNSGTFSDRPYATVGGGYSNWASESYSSVGGGVRNTASGDYSAVGGGEDNTTIGRWSTVGGGRDNMTTSAGNFSTVAGGVANTASGNSATVAGGSGNTASGKSSTVAGGVANTASGDYSFAAGKSAIASHRGSFVWGDDNGGGSVDFNTFNIHASGGIYLNGGVHAASDRNMKKAFSFVSARDVLDKVVELPVTTWRFKSEDDSIRHIGPMAQDFMAAFGYGVNDTHITATDADGVALAAIQGLYAMQREELQKQAEVNTALRWHNAQLQAMLRSGDESLEARIARLENVILRDGERAPSTH